MTIEYEIIIPVWGQGEMVKILFTFMVASLLVPPFHLVHMQGFFLV